MAQTRFDRAARKAAIRRPSQIDGDGAAVVHRVLPPLPAKHEASAGYYCAYLHRYACARATEISLFSPNCPMIIAYTGDK